MVWVGEHRVLTTGFGADRCRQLILRDTRSVSFSPSSLSSSSSPGSCRARSTFSPSTSPLASLFPSLTPTPIWSFSRGKATGNVYGDDCVVSILIPLVDLDTKVIFMVGIFVLLSHTLIWFSHLGRGACEIFSIRLVSLFDPDVVSCLGKATGAGCLVNIPGVFLWHF